MFAKKADDEGASSEGFSTIAFPADRAPISGSKDSPAKNYKMRIRGST